MTTKASMDKVSTISKQGLSIDNQKLASVLGFEYVDGELQIEGASLTNIATSFGTPAYVYSKQAIQKAYRAYTEGFSGVPHRICYAVKANANLAVLKILADMGAGFDIVSQGELRRVLQVTDASRVVYSGVGKTADDIKVALLAGIDCFNVEALSELALIDKIAGQLGVQARISLRINPDVDAKTHPYISTGLQDNKFGIDHKQALTAYDCANSLKNLQIVGMDCHIGSQLLAVAPFVDALERLVEFITALKVKGIVLQHLDLGGGLGVRYIDENPVSVHDYAKALMPRLQKLGLTLYLEPGRNLVANAGVLLTTVDVLKPTTNKNFAVVDASMAELLRPALYQAVMAIIPCQLTSKEAAQTWQVVGAVCESADFLGNDRVLALAVGDVLAITGAGAYGFVMASNYNSRPRPAEVLIDDGTPRLIRRRESWQDLWRLETP